MNPIPEKLTGSGRLVQTINRLIDAVKERQIVDSATVKTEKRTQGTSLIATGAGAGAQGDENVWQ